MLLTYRATNFEAEVPGHVFLFDSESKNGVSTFKKLSSTLAPFGVSLIDPKAPRLTRLGFFSVTKIKEIQKTKGES